MSSKFLVWAMAANLLVLAASTSFGQSARLVNLDFTPICASADGSVVLGSRYELGCSTACALQICRWTAATGTEIITTTPDGANGPITAQDCSSDGSVFVGLWRDQSTRRWYRWANGVFEVYGEIRSPFSIDDAVVVSGDGRVVYGVKPGQTDFFRWELGGAEVLLPRWTADQAYVSIGDTSHDGSTFVARGRSSLTNGYDRTLRYRASQGWVLLPNRVGGTNTLVYAQPRCTADGSVVVGESWLHGVRWNEAGEVTDLGLPAGVSLAFPSGISSNAAKVVMNEVVVVNGFPNIRNGLIWDSANGTRWLRDAMLNDHGLVIPSGVLYVRTISADARTFLAAIEGTWFLIVIDPPCPADVDNDGDFSNGGTHDGGVTIDDLLYFLIGFEAGSVAVDLDNDGDPAVGTPDGAVTIDDLLFFLAHFEAGC